MKIIITVITICLVSNMLLAQTIDSLLIKNNWKCGGTCFDTTQSFTFFVPNKKELIQEEIKKERTQYDLRIKNLKLKLIKKSDKNYRQWAKEENEKIQKEINGLKGGRDRPIYYVYSELYKFNVTIRKEDVMFFTPLQERENVQFQFRGECGTYSQPELFYRLKNDTLTTSITAGRGITADIFRDFEYKFPACLWTTTNKYKIKVLSPKKLEFTYISGSYKCVRNQEECDKQIEKKTTKQEQLDYFKKYGY